MLPGIRPIESWLMKRIPVRSVIAVTTTVTIARYEVAERTVHRLRSGHEMACVKMIKVLIA